MKILFVHKHLPGQFEHLIWFLSQDRCSEVVCLCQDFRPQQYRFSGLRVETYSKTLRPGGPAREFLFTNEDAVTNGIAVARKLAELSRQGFVPDIAFAHLSWGEPIYFKDIYPDTPLIGYCEFYYHARGVDADFDPAFPLDLNGAFRIRTANAANLLGLVGIDLGVSPTQWQKSLFPPEFQRKIMVIHEGVDTARIKPDAEAVFRLPNGLELSRRQSVVTYATRNLEPYRGFPMLMHAVADLCRRRPECHFIIAGGDEVSYSALSGRKTYRERLLREVAIDPERVHFVGRLPFDDYLKLLQISSAHIYLTVPFVLSWSLMEAMAAECVIIGSDTAPVREILRHGQNGLLADFFSPREIADMVDRVLDHPNLAKDLGRQARADIINSFEVAQSVSRYRGLIDRLLSNMQRTRGAA